MIYNEWIKGKTSLFSELQNTGLTSQFIVDYGAENLDLIYKMGYGTKTIPKSIENLTISELAKIISISYGDNWSKKYTLLQDEILLGVENKTVTNETVADNSTRTTNSNQTSKVSAFNVDVLSTNNGSDDSVDDDSTKDVTKSKDTTKTGFNVIKDQLELFDSNFVSIVVKDVSKIVSLSIY